MGASLAFHQLCILLYHGFSKFKAVPGSASEFAKQGELMTPTLHLQSPHAWHWTGTVVGGSHLAPPNWHLQPQPPSWQSAEQPCHTFSWRCHTNLPHTFHMKHLPSCITLSKHNKLVAHCHIQHNHQAGPTGWKTRGGGAGQSVLTPEACLHVATRGTVMTSPETK